MNPFYFEEKKKEDLELSSKEISIRGHLFKVTDILDEQVFQSSTSIQEIYLFEFLPDLQYLIEKYSACGVEPACTQKVIRIVEKLIAIPFNKEVKHSILLSLSRIKDELLKLGNTLAGKIDSNVTGKISFPVIRIGRE